jgi:hypothetical protein
MHFTKSFDIANLMKQVRKISLTNFVYLHMNCVAINGNLEQGNSLSGWNTHMD